MPAARLAIRCLLPHHFAREVPNEKQDIVRSGRHQLIGMPEQCQRAETELVFPSRRGGFLKVSELRWVFDPAVQTVRAATMAQRQQEIEETGQAQTPEFPVISPHDLRHTCASLATGEGAVGLPVVPLLGLLAVTPVVALRVGLLLAWAGMAGGPALIGHGTIAVLLRRWRIPRVIRHVARSLFP